MCCNMNSVCSILTFIILADFYIDNFIEVLNYKEVILMSRTKLLGLHRNQVGNIYNYISQVWGKETDVKPSHHRPIYILKTY